MRIGNLQPEIIIWLSQEIDTRDSAGLTLMRAGIHQHRIEIGIERCALKIYNRKLYLDKTKKLVQVMGGGGRAKSIINKTCGIQQRMFLLKVSTDTEMI